MTALAASEHRNTANAATSSASTNCLVGWAARITSRRAVAIRVSPPWRNSTPLARSPSKHSFRLCAPDGRARVETGLLGAYNVSNLMAVAAVVILYVAALYAKNLRGMLPKFPAAA